MKLWKEKRDIDNNSELNKKGNEIPVKKETENETGKLDSRRKSFVDSLKYEGGINHNIPKTEKKKPSEDTYKEERQLELGKNVPVKENKKNKDIEEMER